jgi:hypothetical protein
MKEGSQIIESHPTIQGLDELGRAGWPTATAAVAKLFINAHGGTDGIRWTDPLARP